MVLKILLVKVTHTFSLPGQTLPGPFGDRECVFQDVVPPLRPFGAAGRVAFFRSVGEQWLHFFFYGFYIKMMLQLEVPEEVVLRRS